MSDTVVSYPAPVSTAKEEPAERPLGGTVLRGLLWLSGVRWLAQVFTWASTLVIARLLVPEDYGLVAMATIVTGFLEIFTDSLGASIIQAKNLTKQNAEEMMGATCLFGLGAASLVALGAPVWASVQGEPAVVPVLRVLAILVLLTSVGNIPYCMLNRRLAFREVAKGQFARGLITAAVTLGCAFVLKSYWAIVIGTLCGRSVFTIILIAYEPVKLRLPTRGTGSMKLLRWSGVMTGERFFYQLRTNIDLGIVGARLGAQVLGTYTMAVALALMPLDKLGAAFAPVAYPAFAKLQDNKAELRRYFLALTLGTMAIAFPAGIGLALTADLLIPTILGDKWLAAILPMQIASVVTPLIFHMGIVNPLINALGRIDLNLRVTMLTTLLTIPAVLIGVQFGIAGVAAGSAAVFAIMGIYGESLAWRLIGLRPRDVFITLMPVLSASVTMAVCVQLATYVLPPEWPGVVRLMIEVATGAASFVGAALVLHRGIVVEQLRSLRATWAAR